MPGSLTTPSDQSARVDAPGPVAFRSTHSVGFSGRITFVAQWLAYALPCRRFAPALTDGNARLGADVGRYSFIAVDLHHLLLAGLPAHPCENAELIRRFLILIKLTQEECTESNHSGIFWRVPSD